ncbi:MAG: hypothetical protein WAM39_30785 [Bryobacteraceae bacterium]
MVLSLPPEQAGDAKVDLVNQCQVLVALGVLDFIDADGVDLRQFPVFQAQVTTCSTASKTLFQEVRKASAVSFHESRRAQLVRKSI